MSQAEIDAIFDDWDRRVRQKTRTETLHGVLVDLYTARFDHISDALQAGIEGCDDATTLRHWVPLFATGSAEQIAAAVLGPTGAC